MMFTALLRLPFKSLLSFILYYISKFRLLYVVLIHAFFSSILSHSTISDIFPVLGPVLYYFRFFLLFVLIWGSCLNGIIYRDVKIYFDKYQLFIILYICSAIVSIIYNAPYIDELKSFTSLQYTLFPLAASLTYIQIIYKRHISYIANALLILTFICIIISFIQIRINFQNVTQSTIGAIFSDRNMYARFLVVATSYLLISYLSQKRKMLFDGKLLFILLIFLNITLLFSRAGYVLYLVSVIFIIWQTRNRYLKTYGLVFFTIFVTLLFSFMVYKRIAADKMNVKNSSDLARISVLKAGFNMIQKNPIYGVGYKAASSRFSEFEDKNLPGLVLVRTIHNIYINVFAEQGIIGFTLYVLFNFGILINLWKRIHPIKLIRDKKDELFCFVALAVFMIHGIVYHTYDYEGIYWVIIAMCIVVLRDTRPKNSNESSLFLNK